MANPSLQIGNDNWAIKEDNLLGYSTAGTRFVPQPITMTRATSGTRVNSSGLVETVELFGSELVVNGDFSNGLSDWGTSNVSLVSGGANLNNIGLSGANTYLIQSNLIAGKYYKLELDVIDTNGADLVLEQASSTSIEAQTTGHKIVYFTQGASSYIVIKRLSGDTNVVIDNISVKEVTKNNLARVDYDGTASSLLVEPQRTNLVTYSEDFSNSSWQKNSATVTSGFTSADGTENAYRLQGTVIGSNIKSDLIHIGAGYGSLSIYVRSSLSNQKFKLNWTDGGAGIVSSTEFTATNEWVRYEFSNEIYASSFDHKIISTTENLDIEIFAAQFELGSYPTSYIPTDGGTVTRNQDIFTRDGIGSLINSTEGVLFLEASALSNDGTSRCISIFQNGSNFIKFLYSASSNRVDFVAFSGGNVSCNITKVINNTTENTKFALKWKVNDFALWIDGTEVGTDLSGDAPLGMDKMYFTDEGGSGSKFFGKVKQLQVFKTALTDAQLTSLTS